jgi:hypothetical protein
MFPGVEMGTVGDYSHYKGLTFQFTDVGSLVVLLIFVSEILEQYMYWWGFPLRAQTGIFWRPLLSRPVGC